MHYKPSDFVLSNCERLSCVNAMYCKVSNEIDVFNQTHLLFFVQNSIPINKFSFGGEIIQNCDNIKVLGVNFQSNLKWTTHVNKLVQKCQSLSYSIRILYPIMSRKQPKMIINAHVISQLTYAMPVWAGNLRLIDVRRLNSVLFKLVRLHCRDFSNLHSYKVLSDMSGIRSLTSLRIMADTIMLYRLVTYPLNTEITLRLIQQSSFSFRYPNRIVFFDFSINMHGRSSFIYRSKYISELITFPWTNLSINAFRTKLKNSIPTYIT